MSEPMYTDRPPIQPCACGHKEHYQVNGACLSCDCIGRHVCPTCGHSTAPFWFGLTNGGAHSEDDGSCISCGPEIGRRCAWNEDPTCLCTPAERTAKRCSVPCPAEWIR